MLRKIFRTTIPLTITVHQNNKAMQFCMVLNIFNGSVDIYSIMCVLVPRVIKFSIKIYGHFTRLLFMLRALVYILDLIETSININSRL